MYQSFVYLETRILLSPVDAVFVKDQTNNQITVNGGVMQQVFSLVRALGSSVPASVPVEHLTGKLPVQPEDKKISGYSVKVAEGR